MIDENQFRKDDKSIRGRNMSTMRKTKGSGVMPAVMTFWNADESFNQKETERYIQWVLDCGAHSPLRDRLHR